MKATYSSGGKTMTTAKILKKKTSQLSIPVRAVDDDSGEIICLGFRSNMLECEGFGGVDTGTGLGSDFILLRWRDKALLVRGGELLKAWVATIYPEDAKNFPESF